MTRNLLKSARFLVALLFVSLGLNGWGQTISTSVSNGTFTTTITSTSTSTGQSGSWIVPCGVTSFTVTVIGGGGGGGSSQSSPQGSGGGGGGYAQTTYATVSPGTSFNYQVGRAGLGSTSNAAGQAGGQSWFQSATFLFGNGGNGGAQQSSSSANGGTAGGTGSQASGAGANGAASTANSGGAGGNNGLGTGGAPTNTTGNSAGQAGTIGGGGAGGNWTSGGRNDGGNGGFGRIIITYQGPNAGVDQTLAACATSTILSANVPPASGSTGTWSCVSGCTGVTFTNVNDPNATVSGLTIGVNPVLRWTWTGGGAGCTSINDDIVINTVAGPGCQTYCTPTGFSNSTDGYINGVNINSGAYSTTNTGWGAGGYQNFSATCVTVQQGQTFPINVTIRRTSSFNMFGTYWIDWNGDGNFTNDGGGVSFGNTAGGTADYNFPLSITVPCDAAIGNIRIRFGYQYNQAPNNPCASNNIYGEYEDYCLNIIAEPQPISNAGPDQNLTCTSSATLNASGSTPLTGYWSLVSGTGTITSPTNTNSTVTGLSNGDNIFEWTAIGSCSTSTDQVIINVSGLPNVPVYAGDDVFTCVPVSLTGSSPEPYTGQWVVLSQPGGSPAVIFTPDNTTPDATASNLVNGVYTLQWQVNTLSCGVLTDNVTINFGSLPTPNAGPDQVVCPSGTVLAANEFSGAIGTWSIVSQPGGSNAGFINVNDPNTLVYGLIVGSYTLRWSVSGGGCAGGTFDDMVITVNNCSNPVSHSTTSDQVFTGCNYTYTDNGGAAGNYANNINMTWTTFCPDNPNSFATLTFTSSSFLSGDYVVIYDSPNPGAPIVGVYSSSITNPPLNTTITSSTGCLYVLHHTNASGVAAGWQANVGCSSTAGVQSQQYVNEQNCGGGGGITVCGSGTYATTSNMSSNPPDLGFENSGCLQAREGTSNQWVYLNVSSPGYIVFQINPAGGQDFDYAIWGPYDGLACPGVTLDDPIRCSFAFNGGSGCPANIGLGFVNTVGNAVLPGDVSEGPTCTATNDGWTYPIWAEAGDVFVMLIQNFGNNNSNYNFTINSAGLLAGNQGAGLNCDAPVLLPVELIEFSGEKVDRVNKLYWATASENNNDYFTIEKSSDGLNWQEMATVDGAGNATYVNNYSIIDENPTPGMNYYRLSQTDYDGTRRSYKIVAINTEIEIIDQFSHLYPNPTSTYFHFNYGGKDFSNPIQLEMYDATGKLVKFIEFDSFNNSQNLEVETTEIEAGMYQVILIQNGHQERRRISIIH